MDDKEKLKSAVESLLFASGVPVKIEKLSKICGFSKKETLSAIKKLQEEYLQGRGLAIIEKKGSFQMVSAPKNASFVVALEKGEMQGKLSQAALEVLSIVAYRGPILRSDIESIRGVNCSFTLRSLLMRGLVERNENPSDNRAYLYEISFEFLKKLGVESVEKLPDWEKLSQDERLNNVLEKSEER